MKNSKPCHPGSWRGASALVRLVAALLASTAMSAAPAANPGTTDWVLAYEGKSTNRFIWDKRANALIRTRVPARLSDHVLEALGGPPDPVLVTDHRYLAVSACRAHSCDEKGFFWLDSKTGIGLGGYFVAGALQLASNGLTADRLPEQANKAVLDWLADEALYPQAVEFIGTDGKPSTLPAARFTPPPRYQPGEGGPSFDCGAARTKVEKTICADSALAKLDLDVAELVSSLRHGHDTTTARTELRQLQRAWLKERDARCGSSAEAAACLAAAYRAQHDRLMNWIPGK